MYGKNVSTLHSSQDLSCGAFAKINLAWQFLGCLNNFDDYHIVCRILLGKCKKSLIGPHDLKLVLLQEPCNGLLDLSQISSKQNVIHEYALTFEDVESPL